MVKSTPTTPSSTNTASGSRTPRPKTLTPSPPRSRAVSMTRAEEPDSMVLLRTIDFAARVSTLSSCRGSFSSTHERICDCDMGKRKRMGQGKRK
jgi:hypothetical protein